MAMHAHMSSSVTLRKCSRCGDYFNNDEPTCTFHNAPWIDVHVPGKGSMRLGVWTCCKEVTRTAPGCQKSPHIEDHETTELLRKFEVVAVKGTRAQALELLDSEFIQKNLGTTQTVHMVAPGQAHVRVHPTSVFASAYTTAQDEVQVVGYASKPLPNQVPMRVFKRHQQELPTPVGYTKYTIQPRDTLPGIALRFGVTVAAIKRLNKLFVDNDLYKLKTLLIPNSPDSPDASRPLHGAAPLDSFTQAWHISKLAEGKGVCREEALFYLSDNDWDLISAGKCLEEDIAWAEAELKKQRSKLVQWLGDTDVQTVAVVAAGCIIVLLCIVL